MGQQCLHEVATAPHMDVTAGLLFECRHLRCHVALQKDGWLPGSRGTGVGCHIFGGGVDFWPKGLIWPIRLPNLEGMASPMN